MRIRTLLLSSVMFGSVAMLSSVSWSQSAPVTVYKPQGNWAVTRMAAKGPGKDPYCTMARRFGDNVILTFARNAKEETSLAMDFQPDTLAKGQSYYVVLDAGNNEKRAFDVSPVSDKAMIIRLGQDSKFHDALNSSGVLNVDVAGLAFAFNVPDMAKGDRDLGECVATVTEPASGSPMKSVAAKEPDADSSIVRRATDDILAAPVTKMMPEPPMQAMQEDVPAVVAMAPVVNEGQSQEAESLREENMRLKNALERERRTYENKAMQENSGSSQVSEVMEKIKLLETENSDLKHMLASTKNSKAAAADPKLADEMAMLREENESLRAEASGQKTLGADPKLVEEIATLRKENESLKSAMSSQPTSSSGIDPKLASEMAILREENAGLRAEISEKTSGSGVDPKLASEIAKLREQNTALQADIMAQKTAKAQVDPKIAEDISKLREENTRLKNEILAQKSKGTDVDSKLATEIAKLRDENASLKAGMQIQKTAKSDVDSTVAQEMASLRSANEALKAEVAGLRTAKVAVDPKLADEIALLRQENAQLKQDMMAQKTAKADANDNPNLADEIAILRDENQSLRAEISAQASGNNQAVASGDVTARMQSRIDDLTKQNAKLQSDIMSAQMASKAPVSSEGAISVSQLRSIEQQLKSVETERDSLRAQMDKMADGKGDGLIKLSGADWNLEQATRRFNEAEREIRRLGSQLEQSRAQCTTEKKEIEYMLFDPEIADQEQISKLMSLESEVNTVKAELAQKNTEVSNLKAQLGGSGMASAMVRSPVAPVSVASIEPAAGTPRQGMMPMPGNGKVDAEVIAAPAMRSPAPVPVTAPMPVPAQAASSNLVTADMLSNQLRQAGLALSGGVKKIDNVSGPGFVAYSWNASGLFGTAEQKTMSSPDQFQSFVTQYLDKTKSRCAGEFAASPVPTQAVAGVTVASYEVACVGADGTGATAALAFYGKNGLFTTVAHESSMDTMETAMDARDRVIAGLGSSGKATN